MIGTNIATALLVLLISAVGGVLPMTLGFILAKLVNDRAKTFLPYGIAVSLGIVLSTFYDLLQETAGLQLGSLNPITQTITVLMFLIGLTVLSMVPSREKSSEGLAITSVLVLGWAVGLGLHGFGEGIVIGYGFISNQAAYADATQILSYGLHKSAEGFTLGILLWISRQRISSWVASGLIAGLPVGIGGVLGFLTSSAELSTYAFATGAGFTAYLAIQFSKLISEKKRMIYVAVAAGFLFMYLAGLLHQF
jgi:zinc transporter ZupT